MHMTQQPPEDQPSPGTAQGISTPAAPPAQPTGALARTEGGAALQEGASAFLPDGTPIDNIRLVRATVRHPVTGVDQEVTAAATDPSAAVPTTTTRELGAAGVTRTLSPPGAPQVVMGPTPESLIARWLNSAVHKRLGNAIDRGPTDLGLVGQGYVAAGHMILMDAETGELHRVMPGTRIEDDRVYVNTRNLPEWLVENPSAARG